MENFTDDRHLKPDALPTIFQHSVKVVERLLPQKLNDLKEKNRLKQEETERLEKWYMEVRGKFLMWSEKKMIFFPSMVYLTYLMKVRRLTCFTSLRKCVRSDSTHL
jgi:hypothetical protein